MPWIFEPVFPSRFSLTGGLHFLKTFVLKTTKLMSVLLQMQDYAAGDLPLLKKSVNKINEVRIFLIYQTLFTGLLLFFCHPLILDCCSFRPSLFLGYFYSSILRLSLT